MCIITKEITTVMVFGYLILIWYDTLKYGDAHEKFNFMKIEDLIP